MSVPQAKGSVLARIVDLQTGQSVWQEESRQTIPAGISYWERSIVWTNPSSGGPMGWAGSHSTGWNSLCVSQSRTRLHCHPVRRPQIGVAGQRRPQPAALAPDGYAWDSRDSLDMGMNAGGPMSGYRLPCLSSTAVRSMPKALLSCTSDDLLALTPEREAWLVEAARVSI